jgi:hypothetical protein
MKTLTSHLVNLPRRYKISNSLPGEIRGCDTSYSLVGLLMLVAFTLAISIWPDSVSATDWTWTNCTPPIFVSSGDTFIYVDPCMEKCSPGYTCTCDPETRKCKEVCGNGLDSVDALATQVGQLTGSTSTLNGDMSAAADVYGTDLGSMYLYDGKMYFLFGDTKGYQGANWRSNAAAYSTDFNVAGFDDAHGIEFDGWINVDANGKAKALVERAIAQPVNNCSNVNKSPPYEYTKIPTHGWSIGNRQYLSFQSISYWGNSAVSPCVDYAGGYWAANYSQIAYSDDNWASYSLAPQAKWAGTGNFVQVAEVTYGSNLYFWGIPAGRYGAAKLDRVPADPNQVIDKSYYSYYTGDGWSSAGADESSATTVASSRVGEPSVIWNPFLQRWIMMYLDDPGGAIVVRDAANPEGPWSSPQTVATASQYPYLYGAFMHERYTENGGETVYFLMSRDSTIYNVFLVKVKFIRNKQTGCSY